MEKLLQEKDLSGGLARTHVELQLLLGLSRVLEDEIEPRAVFSRIIEYLRRVLPLQKARVWVPNRSGSEGDHARTEEQAEAFLFHHDLAPMHHQASRYLCIFHEGAGDPPEHLKAFPRDPELEDEILLAGTRTLCGCPALTAADNLVLRLAVGMEPPIIACPLRHKTRFLGLLVLQAGRSQVDENQVRLLEAAARQSSLALYVHWLVEEVRSNEGLRREIEIARQIQHGLLPQNTPRGERFDLYAGCVTAARVGGDFYDFIREPDGSVGLLVSDVAGHSVASALIATSFRSYFRQHVERGLAPAAILQAVNRLMHGELQHTGSFLSAFYGVLDERTLKLRYSNGGHPRPLVHRAATGEIHALHEAGLLVGVLPDEEYPSGEVELSGGDVLLLYTDGIAEAEDQGRRVFGRARLEDALRRGAGQGAPEIFHEILRTMHSFQCGLPTADDVTLVVLKVRG